MCMSLVDDTLNGILQLAEIDAKLFQQSWDALVQSPEGHKMQVDCFKNHNDIILPTLTEEQKRETQPKLRDLSDEDALELFELTNKAVIEYNTDIEETKAMVAAVPAEAKALIEEQLQKAVFLKTPMVAD